MDEGLVLFPKTLVMILVGILIFALLVGILSNFLISKFNKKTAQLEGLIKSKKVLFEQFSAQEAATFYEHFFKIKKSIQEHTIPTRALEAIAGTLPYFVKINSLSIDFNNGSFSFSGSLPTLYDLAKFYVSLKKEPVYEKVNFGGFSYSRGGVNFSISGNLKPEYYKLLK